MRMFTEKKRLEEQKKKQREKTKEQASRIVYKFIPKKGDSPKEYGPTVQSVYGHIPRYDEKEAERRALQWANNALRNRRQMQRLEFFEPDEGYGSDNEQ